MGKKILLGVVIFIGVLLAGVFIFINTFNLNKYLPQITKQASQAIGRDVKIEKARLHLSLLKGVAASVEGVLISDDPAFGKRPFLTVSDIQCGVRFLPLLTKRQVEVSYVRIHRPEVVLIKGTTGKFNFESLMTPVPSSESGKGGPTVPVGTPQPAEPVNLPLLLVNTFEMDKAKVTYIDQSSVPPMEFTAQDIDIQVTGFSLTEPFKIKAEASLFSEQPNVHVSGTGRLDMKLQQARLDDVHVDVDLSRIDVVKLNKAVAALEPVGIQSMKGQVTIVANQLLAGAGGLLVLSAEGQLADGQIKLKPLAVPIDKILVKFDASESRINIKQFSLALGSGQVTGQGAVKDYMTAQQFDLNTAVKQIPLGEIIDQKNYPAQLKGSLSGTIKLNGQGFTPEALNKIAGSAVFSISGGEIVNFNIVKSVLDSLAMLPGLSGVENKLPPELRTKIGGKSTKIDKANVRTRIELAQVLIDEAKMEAQGCLLSAHGSAGFDQTIALTAELVFLKEMAGALMSSSKEIGALADENQEIHIPVKITGKVPALSVLPDMNYLTKRLLVNEGSKQLEKVVGKNPEVKKLLNIFTGGREEGDGSEASQAPDESSSTDEESPEKKLLNNLFKGF